MEFLQRSLSEIATTVGGASAVLREHNLDFCCAGEKTLEQALAEKGLASTAILNQLQTIYRNNTSSEKDWSKESATSLIAHILQRYHAPHREQLPELIYLAGKVERVHKGKTHCPKGLSELLRDFFQELDGHMMKEEQILFPMLGGGIYPNGPINVMQEEHQEHMDMVEKVYALTNTLQAPADACNTWRALYVGLQTFIDDLMQHITMENYFLFSPQKFEE